MIDALFGSKTRVKLLHLFLNNPGKAFYVREITRLIDEQINSVRRELANMLEVGIITSDSSENKLYYEVNQRYEYYVPFRGIFADQKVAPAKAPKKQNGSDWETELAALADLRVAIAAGVLVPNSASSVDLLLVGSLPEKKVGELVRKIESHEGRELSYSVLSYDEFYYRLSVRDKFIIDILTNKHRVLVDADNILKTETEE
jgi:hypothetical protein